MPNQRERKGSSCLGRPWSRFQFVFENLKRCRSLRLMHVKTDQLTFSVPIEFWFRIGFLSTPLSLHLLLPLPLPPSLSFSLPLSLFCGCKRRGRSRRRPHKIDAPRGTYCCLIYLQSKTKVSFTLSGLYFCQGAIL